MSGRSLAPLTLALVPLALSGCEHPPRVPTTWANQARGVISADTPEPGSRRTIVAKYGPREDRDEDDLTDLDGDDDLGEVVVELEAGVYGLEVDAVIEGADAFVLKGAGPHKTRIELDTDTLRALTLRKIGRVELRGVTVVGYTGGGLYIEECDDVRVEDAHFAGARVGLSLESSTARIGTSVFAGCQAGVIAKDSEVTLRESAFLDCWNALVGDGGAFDVESSAFLENREVFDATLDSRSRIVSNLFGGNEQGLGWKGRPAIAKDNLAHARDLGDRLGRFTNREVRDPADFPRGLLIPEDFDVVGVHLALERGKKRGEKDPPKRLEELARTEAEAFALVSQRALRARDLPAARRAARIALRYLGELELSEAPQAVIDIAELGRTP